MAAAKECNQSAYSLKDFVARHPLPKNVRVEDGFYADKDEGTLSSGQIITLHTKKQTDKLRATIKTEDGEASTELFIPLNCGEKVKILPSVGREMYDNIPDLLHDSPPLVRVVHTIPWLHLVAGDVLRPTQNIVGIDRGQFLVCEFYDKSRDHVKIPVNYHIAFEALAAADVYFLREVVKMFPLPVSVRFVESASGFKASSFVGELKRLGVVTLEERIVEETMIASSQVENTVVILNMSVDLDVTVTPEPDPTPGDRSYARFCNFMHDGAKLERYSDWLNQIRQQPPTVETIDEYMEIGPQLPPRTRHDSQEEIAEGRTSDDNNDGQDAIEMPQCHFEPPPRPPKPPRFSQFSDVSRESLRQDPDGQEDETVFENRDRGADVFHEDIETEEDKDVYEPWEAVCSHQSDVPQPPERTASLRHKAVADYPDETPPTICDQDEDYLLPVNMEFPPSIQSSVELSPGLPTVDSSDEDEHEYLEIDDKVKPQTSRAKRTIMKLFGGMKMKLSNLSNADAEPADAHDAEGTKQSDDYGNDCDGGGNDNDEYDDDEYDVLLFGAGTNIPEYHKSTKDLSVHEVGQWLRTLNMEQHASVFENERIDGDLLCGLTEDELQDLGVTRSLDVKRIMKFTEGWRPNTAHT